MRGLGNESEGTARKMTGLFGGGGRKGLDTRVSLGPFSTSLRFAIPLLGEFVNLLPGAVTGVLGLAEALGTGALGLGAAGGVGLLALGQTIGAVTLATNGLSQALAGNADAYARLVPEQQRFVDQLESMRPMLDDLRGTAARNLFPGVTAGLAAASRNFPVVRGIVGGTAGALGGLARQAGEQAGSAAFGRDLGTLGRSNIRIIKDLGQAGLSLADAARHILVEAAPLAEWLARQAREGARLIDVWAGNARAGGDLRRFFRGAREDLALFWSVTEHVARGIANIFQASDVDGTRTLRRIDRITRRFETWTRSIQGRGGLSKAIEDAIPELAGPLAEMISRGFILGWEKAVSLLWQAFWRADLGGKLGIAFLASLKFGLFRRAGTRIATTLIGGIVTRVLATEAITNAFASIVGPESPLRGRMRGYGRGLGRAIGLGLATGAVLGLADLAGQIENKIYDTLPEWMRHGIELLGDVGSNLGGAAHTVVEAGGQAKHSIDVLTGHDHPIRSVQPMRPRRGGGVRTDLPRLRNRPPAHLDAVMGGDAPRVRHGKPPDIVIHSHVHTNDREIGKATGRHTWREDDRR